MITLPYERKLKVIINYIDKIFYCSNPFALNIIFIINHFSHIMLVNYENKSRRTAEAAVIISILKNVEKFIR